MKNARPLTAEELKRAYIHLPTSVGGEWLYAIIDQTDMDGGDWTTAIVAERMGDSKYKIHRLKVYESVITCCGYVRLNNTRLYRNEFIRAFF